MVVAFVLAATLTASGPADDAEIARGLENLRIVTEIGTILEQDRALGVQPDLPRVPTDPWGTAYRISIEDGIVAGAGSDRKFDDPEPAASAQFEGLEGDVVFRDGRIVRSNRNWLYAHRQADGVSAQALTRLQSAELRFMIMRDPAMRQLAAIDVTKRKMTSLNALVETYRTAHKSLKDLADAPDPARMLARQENLNESVLRDGWGTPLKMVIDGNDVRIISAGADRAFDSAHWSDPPAADAAQDLVMKNGALVRSVDDHALQTQVAKSVDPVAQPIDAQLPDREHGGPWYRVGHDGVAAPIAQNRVNPVYPEAYRRMRMSGVVIVECAINTSGDVEHAAIVKSVAPDFDAAALEAVRQWKFQPATLDGAPVPVLFNVTIAFRLN